jgi:hypothetical protein
LKDIDYEVSASEINLEETGDKGDFTNLNKVFSFFDFHFRNYEGSVYDFLNHAIEMIDSIWEYESDKNIQRKKRFVHWLKHTVKRLNLEPIKLGLEPDTTPEPPQEQDNDDIPITAKPTKKEVLLYFEYTEWGKTFETKTQMFLEISRLFNFSPKSLKVAENDLAKKRETYLNDFDNIERLKALLEGNKNAMKRFNDDLVQHKIV